MLGWSCNETCKHSPQQHGMKHAADWTGVCQSGRRLAHMAVAATEGEAVLAAVGWVEGCVARTACTVI